MTNIQRRRIYKNKYKVTDDHNNFLERISKSLYYGKLSKIPCLSLPVTELCSDLFSEAHKGKSLKRLHIEDAAELSRNACVSPCSLVLALLYLERLKNNNPEYVSKIAPSELFLISLMVSNKFLQDDGEEDEVFCSEWATSGGITLEALHQLEKDFLHAIDWRVYVGEQSFEDGLHWLEHQVAMRQAKYRGWFTYADLVNNTITFENTNLFKCIAVVYLALCISYLASILTLVASTCIVSHGNSIINSYNALPKDPQTNDLCNISIEYPLVNQDTNMLLDNVSFTISHNQMYKNSKLVDLSINSNYFRALIPTLSYTLNNLQEILLQMKFMKLIPDILTRYVTHFDLVDDSDCSLTLNDVYLDLKQPSLSWYRREYSSFSWQYSDSIRY